MSELMTHFRVLSANIVGLLDGLILPVLAAPGKPAEAGGFEPGLPGLADGVTSSFARPGPRTGFLVMCQPLGVRSAEPRSGSSCRACVVVDLDGPLLLSKPGESSLSSQLLHFDVRIDVWTGIPAQWTLSWTITWNRCK